MTVRELYSRLQSMIDRNSKFGDIKVFCGINEIEWAWLISDGDKINWVELSLMKTKEEVADESKNGL